MSVDAFPSIDSLPFHCFRNSIAQNAVEDAVNKKIEGLENMDHDGVGPAVNALTFFQTDKNDELGEALDTALKMLVGFLLPILTEFPDLGASAPAVSEKISKTKELPDSLPQPSREKPICIIGGGACGLYTALILQSLGLKYEILEASDRVGGRLFTYRFNKQAGVDAKVGDPARYDYIDMGAMRFPHLGFQQRVFDLWKYIGIDHLAIPYIMTDDLKNERLYFNGRGVVKSDPRISGETDLFQVTRANGGFVSDSVVQKDNTGNALMEKALGPFLEAFKNARDPSNTPDQVRQAIRDAWKLVTKFDAYSTRQYMLRRPPKVPDPEDKDPYPNFEESTVEWLESMGAGTGMYNHAFVETVRHLS